MVGATHTLTILTIGNKIPKTLQDQHLSVFWSSRDCSGCCGQRVCPPLPSPEAIFWLSRRDPDADAEAGHPAAYYFQHDNR